MSLPKAVQHNSSDDITLDIRFAEIRMAQDSVSIFTPGLLYRCTIFITDPRPRVNAFAVLNSWSVFVLGSANTINRSPCIGNEDLLRHIMHQITCNIYFTSLDDQFSYDLNAKNIFIAKTDDAGLRATIWQRTCPLFKTNSTFVKKMIEGVILRLVASSSGKQTYSTGQSSGSTNAEQNSNDDLSDIKFLLGLRKQCIEQPQLSRSGPGVELANQFSLGCTARGMRVPDLDDVRYCALSINASTLLLGWMCLELFAGIESSHVTQHKNYSTMKAFELLLEYLAAHNLKLLSILLDIECVNENTQRPNYCSRFNIAISRKH